eukprot:scaffold2.g7092.t1
MRLCPCTAPTASPWPRAGQAIVLIQDDFKTAPVRTFLVQTSDGEQVEVDTSAVAREAAALVTGQAVTVKFRAPAASASAAGGGAIAATSLQAGAAKSSKIIVKAAAALAAPTAAAPGAAPSVVLPSSQNTLVEADVATLFVPLLAAQANGSACPGTRLPDYTPADLAAALFEELSPGALTLGRYFRQVSWGAATLTNATSAVAGFANVGCGGGAAAWGWTTCNAADYGGWANAADAYLAANSPGLAARFKHVVYILPPGGPCAWAGLGSLGCASSGIQCRVWAVGDYWSARQLYAHELGHNLYWHHAAARAPDGSWDEYADESCTMGYCCAERGLNLPHAWQAGFTPVQQLDGGTLAPGTPLALTLPALSAGGVATRGARLLPSWAPGEPAVFLGYRLAQGLDAGLSDGFAGCTSVHTSAISNTYDPQLTYLQATLGDGQAWESSAAAGIVVRQVSHDATQATVTVCRVGGAETAASCAGGLDWDCNGLAGAADPTCAAFLPLGPPQPSPSPAAVPSPPPPASPTPAPASPPPASPGAGPPPPGAGARYTLHMVFSVGGASCTVPLLAGFASAVAAAVDVPADAVSTGCAGGGGARRLLTAPLELAADVALASASEAELARQAVLAKMEARAFVSAVMAALPRAVRSAVGSVSISSSAVSVLSPSGGAIPPGPIVTPPPGQGTSPGTAISPPPGQHRSGLSPSPRQPSPAPAGGGGGGGTQRHATPPPLARPAAPQLCAAPAVSNSSAVIRVRAAARATTYAISCARPAVGPRQVRTVSGASGAVFTLSSLRAKTAYTCAVTASNAAGASAPLAVKFKTKAK